MQVVIVVVLVVAGNWQVLTKGKILMPLITPYNGAFLCWLAGRTDVNSFSLFLVTVTTDGKERKDCGGTVSFEHMTVDPPFLIWIPKYTPSSITANPPPGYQFDHWEASRFISVANSNAQTTTVTPFWSGMMLIAVFKPV